MSSIRILIVEDHLLIAKDISIKLQNAGYEITDLAISGEVALQSIRLKTPDIILMDIDLDGDLDGVDTVREIQKTHPAIPIIYLTDHDDKRTFNRAKYTNPASFIPKPFNLRSMSNAIDLALFNASQQHSAAQAQAALSTSSSESNSNLYLLENCIFVRDRQTYQKVKINDILWIEAAGSYTNIITTHKVFNVAVSSNKFEERIQHPHLQRVHRTYIVNINHIKSMDNATVQMEISSSLLKFSIKQKSGIIPVGNHYRKEFFKRFSRI